MTSGDSANNPNHQSAATESLHWQNVDTLRESKLGPLLLDAYVTAINYDKRLDTVQIIPLTDDTQRIAFARPRWDGRNTDHTHNQVYVRLDNLDEALARHQTTLDSLPGARELFAEILDIEPADVTPQLLHVFSFLHELGHTIEYMNYDSNPGEYSRKKRSAEQALPIANTALSTLIAQPPAERRRTARRYGDSFNAILERQLRGYRGMEFERSADVFAANIFALNPNLLAQLTRGDLDYYRTLTPAHTP